MNVQARSAPSSPRLMMDDLHVTSEHSSTECGASVRSSSPPGQKDPDRPSKASAVSSLTASLAALAGIRTREEAAEQSRSDSPSSRARAQAGLRRHSFESSLAARQKHARSSPIATQHGTSGAASSQSIAKRFARDQQPEANRDLPASGSLLSDGTGQHGQSSKGSKPGSAGRSRSRPHSLDDTRLRDMPSGKQLLFDVDQLPLQDDPQEPGSRRSVLASCLLAFDHLAACSCGHVCACMILTVSL